MSWTDMSVPDQLGIVNAPLARMTDPSASVAHWTAFTIATMPTRTASGSPSQAWMIAARSAGKCAAFCAAWVADSRFSREFWGLFDPCRG
jgi:hypothetical protein